MNKQLAAFLIVLLIFVTLSLAALAVDDLEPQTYLPFVSRGMVSTPTPMPARPTPAPPPTNTPDPMIRPTPEK